jgi:hypothetical protein
MSAGPMMIIATLGVEPTYAARAGSVLVGSIGEGSIRVDRESWAAGSIGERDDLRRVEPRMCTAATAEGRWPRVGAHRRVRRGRRQE